MVFKGLVVPNLHFVVPNLHRFGIVLHYSLNYQRIYFSSDMLSVYPKIPPKTVDERSAGQVTYRKPIIFFSKQTWKTTERYMQNYIKLCPFLRHSHAGSSALVRKP